MKKILIIVFLLTSFINAQQLAFPTANGAGSYVTGGRGLNVYKVTNLNDSGTGSLRWAIGQADANNGGTIVFEVSGIINLNSTLSLTSNLTIAGQTAPAGGITIDGGRVFVSFTDNLIVRYIRFRGGVDDGNDSVTVRRETTNQIWDHCSFGFGDDEGASWYEASASDNIDNITVQRCLFGENSKGSIVGGANNIAPTGDISFNYNLFYNNSHRFPNTSGTNANIEVINNVVWNVNSRLVRVNGEGQNLNHINNYYHYNNRGINDDRIHAFSYQTGYPNIYTSGNKIVAPILSSPLTSTVAEMNADNTLSWKHFIDGTSTPLGTRNKGDQLEANYFTGTQHPLLGNPVNIITADEALTELLSDVGANRSLDGSGNVTSNLDAEDTEYLDEISKGNYNTPLTSGNYNVTQFTGSTRSGTYDSDDDGMPDVWENATFGSLSRNGKGDLNGDGYTDLEEYLNLVDEGQAINIPQITRTDSNQTTYELNTTLANPLLTGTWTDVEDGSGSATVGGETVDITTVGTYNATLEHTDTDGNRGFLIVPINVVTPENSVTGVTVTPPTVSLAIGETRTLVRTISPVDATDQTGVWSSSNGSVASINQNGLVTALTEGSTTISYTTNDGSFTDTCIVTVTASSTVVLSSTDNNKRTKVLLINN